jgi:hypothetical protein
MNTNAVIAPTQSSAPEVAQLWNTLAARALRETFASFGVDASAVDADAGLGAALPGAYIPLVSPTAAAEIGLVSGDGPRLAIARAMLGMTDDEVVAMDDAVSCLCEFVNILAGVLKRHAPGDNESLSLGLPFYVDGAVRSARATTTTVERFRFGQDEVRLVVTVGAARQARVSKEESQ